MNDSPRINDSLFNGDGYRAPGDLLKRHGLLPKKSWGQCFLHEVHVARRIVDAVSRDQDALVVEIGAGLGALTGLLARRFRRVVAIERDRDLVAILRDELASETNVEILEANALSFDFHSLGEPVHVVGNLPYNISSPLLFAILAQRDVVRDATVMLQRELAQRLVAPPGSRRYGSPSVTLGLRATITTVLDVGRGAFLPPPKVDSTVLHFDFTVPAVLSASAEALFEEVVRTAFAQRRKKLRRALTQRYPRPLVEAALQGAEVDGDLRAERLDLPSFARLAESFAVELGRG